MESLRERRGRCRDPTSFAGFSLLPGFRPPYSLHDQRREIGIVDGRFTAQTIDQGLQTGIPIGLQAIATDLFRDLGEGRHRFAATGLHHDQVNACGMDHGWQQARPGSLSGEGGIDRTLRDASGGDIVA